MSAGAHIDLEMGNRVDISVGQLENLARRSGELAAAAAVAAMGTKILDREEVKAIAEDVAERIAERTAEKTVTHFLETVGVDSADKVNLRKDFARLRSNRELVEAMQRHGILATVGLLVIAALTVMWVGLKGKLTI